MGWKTHLRDNATTAATTTIEGGFDGSGRNRLSIGSDKDTLNRENCGKEIH
jgi:hypothetical protein